MKKLLLFSSLYALAVLLDGQSIHDPCVSYAVLGLGTALLIGGGLSLLGSAIGAAANASNTSAVNDANLQAARETNQLNREMFNEQMDYNKYMYQDQKAYNAQLIHYMNDYNSPESQRKRFEDAGINPYFALGNIDAGNASSQVGVSAPSAPSAPNMVTPTFQPNNVGAYIAGAGRDVASIMQATASAQNIEADTEQKRIDNLTRFDENIARLEELRARKDLSVAQQQHLDEQITDLRQQRQYVLESLRYGAQSAKSDAQTAKYNTRIAALESRNKQLQNEYQEWLNAYQKKYGDKNLKQLDAIISNLGADSAVKNMQELESKARKQGIEIDNEQKSKLMPLLKRSQELENERKRLENKYGSSWYQGLGRAYDDVRQTGRRNLEKRFGLNRTSRW